MLIAWLACSLDRIDAGDSPPADTDRGPCVGYYGSCDCSAKCRAIAETDSPDTACDLGCPAVIDWTCALEDGRCVVVSR